MKKFQVMMLMMLVAFMGLTIQSCGSDDDAPSSKQNYTLKVALVDTGNLTPASIDYISAQMAGTSKTVKCTAVEAKAALDQTLDEYGSTIPVTDDEGNYLDFTIKFYLVDDSNKEIYSRLMVIKDGKRTIK
jgi:hypothetical protein